MTTNTDKIEAAEQLLRGNRGEEDQGPVGEFVKSMLGPWPLESYAGTCALFRRAVAEVVCQVLNECQLNGKDEAPDTSG